MSEKEFESSVNCPECGESVSVILRSYSGLFDNIVKAFGIESGKTDDFMGDCICKCGRIVNVSLHVTSVIREDDNGNG